jgi:hypothetical protein
LIKKKKEEEELMMAVTFSNNIYEDLSGYDLRTEYRKTKVEIYHVKAMVEAKELSDTP